MLDNSSRGAQKSQRLPDVLIFNASYIFEQVSCDNATAVVTSVALRFRLRGQPETSQVSRQSERPPSEVRRSPHHPSHQALAPAILCSKSSRQMR